MVLGLLSGMALMGLCGSPLEVLPPDSDGWIHLRSNGTTNQVQTLQASTDLRVWHEAALFHDGPF